MGPCKPARSSTSATSPPTRRAHLVTHPSVTITIGVDTIPTSVDSFVEIPVTLRVVSASVPNAIVVPVSALVALKEGGYAVEQVTGSNPDGTNQTKLIGVTPGLFTNGFVQVDGDLKPDIDVVVPS